MSTNTKASTTQVRGVIAALESQDAYLRENWSLPREGARLLGLLIRIRGAQRVLEIGTSVGYSGLHIGLGLLQTGGTLDTVDASSERQAQARAHFEAAGLLDRIHLLTGDALPTMESLKAQGKTYDFLFLDARKSEYADYLKLAESLLTPDGVLLADNTQSHRDEMRPFIEAVLTGAVWEASDIETPSGMILALRRKDG